MINSELQYHGVAPILYGSRAFFSTIAILIDVIERFMCALPWCMHELPVTDQYAQPSVSAYKHVNDEVTTLRSLIHGGA